LARLGKYRTANAFSLDFPLKSADNRRMDIAKLSMAMAQGNVQLQAGTALMAKTLDAAKQQGLGLQKLLSSVPLPQSQALTDPALGRLVNFEA
jgi:hypothetical protein